MLINKAAFSLVELMVVIAIVAILSAVAAPLYKDHIISVKVARNMSILNEMVDTWTRQISLNPTVPSYTVFGSTLGGGTGQALVAGDVRWAYYFTLTGGSSGKYRHCIFISGLDGMDVSDGLGSYTSPGANMGSRAGICIETMIDSNGNIKKYCGVNGTPVGTSRGIPAKYAPSNCQCNMITNPPTC